MIKCFNTITLYVLMSLKVRNVKIFRIHNISSKKYSKNTLNKSIERNRMQLTTKQGFSIKTI